MENTTSPSTTEKKERYPIQHIDLKKSAWIFISASPHESRHLNDIAWSIDCLRHKNVSDENIFIFQDNPDFEVHLKPFGINNNIYDLDNIETVVSSLNAFDFVFFAFTGHGSSEGVHTEKNTFPPSTFIKLARNLKSVKNSVLIVGQCYGGIFDYVDAYVPPEFGIIGATKLNSSLSNSLPTIEKLISLDKTPFPQWSANVFLFYFFNWLKNPTDTDGDGLVSLVDGFKYAGSRANENLIQFKTNKSLDIHYTLEHAKQKIRDHISGKIPLDNIQLESALRLASDESSMLYLNQEPWILHANLLRSLVIT